MGGGNSFARIRQQFEENKEIGAVVSSLEEGLKEQLVTEFPVQLDLY